MDERFLRKNDIIHVIVSGKGLLRIGRQIYRLGVGQGFYIPALTPAFYQADETDPWMYCWILFGGVKLNEYLHAAHIDRRNPTFRCGDPQSYWALISDMLDQCVKSDASVEPRLFAHCHEFSQSSSTTIPSARVPANRIFAWKCTWKRRSPTCKETSPLPSA